MQSSTSVGVVVQGDICLYSDMRFHVSALDPGEAGVGIVDEQTVIFAQIDDVPEFDRIHVVPFSDTLPSAYGYDIFSDYVKPFFESHLLDRFSLGQTFVYNGVHFKVVAAEPRGPRRVGCATQVFHEGQLHPTVGNLLTPEQSRMLAGIPLGLQVWLLQTDMFGDGDLAERIIEAQGARSRAQRQGLSFSAVGQVTEEGIWSEGFRERLGHDQVQCVICLNDFEAADRVRRLPCDHVFHVACVDEWLGRDAHCPLCRTGLTPGRRSRRRPDRSRV